MKLKTPSFNYIILVQSLTSADIHPDDESPNPYQLQGSNELSLTSQRYEATYRHHHSPITADEGCNFIPSQWQTFLSAGK